MPKEVLVLMMADKKKHRANEVYFAENTNITIF